MNYQKIYNQIIERAKTRQLEGYKERHHIIPRCMGGLNDKSNLVELTAREHFICHRLLVKIYPNHNGLTSALWLMVNASRKYQFRYKPSSRIYESLKTEYARNQSINKKGVKREKWVCEKLSKSMKGKSKSSEHASNISKAKTGEGNHMFGVTGINNKRSKPVIQMTIGGEFIKEWPNGLIASKELNINYKAINHCMLGKSKTSGGFIWKSKN